MRHVLAVMLVLLAGLAGCSWTGRPFGRGAPPAEVARRPADGTAGAEAIFLDVALVRRPRGDRYINADLWEQGDEQGLHEDVKPALAANGLRVCQIGGLLPGGLQGLLASPRSCPEPRRLRAAPGEVTPVQVGPTRPKVACRVTLDGESRDVDVEQARCVFAVVPTLEEEKRIRLRFTPIVRHGKTRMKPHVSRDANGALSWAVEPSEPAEEFAPLRWELTVGPGEYVVIGTQSDRAGTLGHAFFLPEAQRGTQHLLVLRATRVPVGQGPNEAMGMVPPLAAQAAGLTARGSGR
jgi:hypothetical protein